MSVSPPMEIKGKDPHINARPQLVYLAELFKKTMRSNPLATIQITGTSQFYMSQIADALEKLQVPAQRIGTIAVSNAYALPPIGFQSIPPGWNLEYSATIVIDYRNGGFKQRFSVEFKPDSKDFPVEVEFEVAPDGTMLTEVKAEWSTPLKKVISDSARIGVRQVKFATKIVGLAGFEQKTVDKIETELKGKLKQTFSFFLKTQGNEFVKIQFYGAVGLKYADDKLKTFGEGGVLFEVPFDITDVFK